MRFLRSLLPSILLLGAGVADAATWGFEEAVISVTGKGGAGSAFKDKYVFIPSSGIPNGHVGMIWMGANQLN